MTQSLFQDISPTTASYQEKTRSVSITLLAVLGALAMIFSAFAGCIIDLDEDERETDEFWYYAAASPRTLDPAVAYDDVSINIINNLYERLVTYRSESGSEIVPMIAKSKQALEDTEYIFYMRDGIKFSTGRVVDAYAVYYSISRVLKMAQAPSWMLRQVLNESGIIQGDFDHDGIEDIKFILKMPYSGFIHILAFSVCSIVDPAEVEEHGGVVSNQTNDWMAHHSAGSGAFKVKEWKEGDGKLTLERNSHYHKGWGGKHFDKVFFRHEESEALRLKAIKGDKADMADIPISLLSDLADVTSVMIDIRDTMGVVFLGFNTQTAPFDNPDVRKAFAHAFDYNALMDDILEKKYGDRLHGPIPEGVLGHDPNLESRFYYDPGEAVEHFEAAGYTIEDNNVTDFEPITIFVPSNASVMGMIMYLFKENLAEIGIEVSIQYMNLTDYNLGLERGDFPVFLAGWGADYADPDDFVYPLLHSESMNLTISNLARYYNASIDEMIEDGKRTLSPDDRTVIYRDIQNAVNRDAPYIWLYQPKYVSVLKNDVSGFNRHPILGTNFYDIYIVE